MSEDLTQSIITEPRRKPILPIIFIVLLVVLAPISGLLAYQNYQLQQKIAQVDTIPSLLPTTSPTIVPASGFDLTANWKTYEIVHDLQFGFSDYEIKLPESWKLQERSSSFQNNETFTYTKPTSQTAGGDFTPGMAWLTINISESSIAQIVESDENKKSASRAVINGLEFTRLNGYGGVGESVYYSNFITIYKGKTYKISFSTQDEAIKVQILRDIDQILSTFKFLGANESGTTGTITGKACYPSEGIPAGVIRAKNIDTGEIVSLDHPIDTPIFSFSLRSGTYKLRFEPGGNSTFPGYYTSCSGVEQSCQDSKKQRLSIPVTVSSGKITSGIKLCDFYYSDSIQPDF